MKRLTPFLLALVLLLAGCGSDGTSEPITRENMGHTTIYHTSLGYAVSLGMPKGEIDEMLGSPRASGDGYFYTDNIYLEFEDGLLSLVYVMGEDSNKWIAKSEATIGQTTRAQIIDSYGDPTNDRESTIYYYLSDNGDVCTSLLDEDAVSYISFTFSDDVLWDIFMGIR